jgi:penicillin-binding protein 1C
MVERKSPRRVGRGRRILRAASLILLTLTALGMAGVGIWYARAIHNLPSVDRLAAGFAVPSTYIYDRDSRLLYEIIDPEAGKHNPLALDEIPLSLQQAVVATEDATFYVNPGFSPLGIVRAFILNLKAGHVVAGGSTITQLLVRNLIFSPDERYDQTLERKAREATLAARLTMRYDKDEILALFLNQVYWGNFAFGIQAAAQAYFGIPASELDLAQSALLAGILQSTSLHNPYENFDSAKARQRVVLDLMARRGYITPAQADLAAGEPLHLEAAPFAVEAPHFAMYVAGILEREIGVERMRLGGLNVYTTLDLDMQRTAEDIIDRRLAEVNRDDGSGIIRRVDNAALVAIDPRSGDLLAMVGSPDYFDARISGAVNGALALRQPGSSLKPFTYAAAFERDYTPATMLLDVRTTFTTREGLPYVPQNYDLTYHGPVLAREALASSYNLPAVIVLDHIGVEQLAELCSQFGISSFTAAERYGLSLTLGGGEVRLLELTTAYAGLAAGGRRVEPVAIRYVDDASGRRLREWQGGPTAQIISPQTAYLITDILSDNQARIAGFGENSWLKLSRPAAAKTGTTTDWRDNWTLGYTPDLVAGVWVGNSDNSPMYGISGVSGAGPIWHDFMERILESAPAQVFVRPEGIVEVEVCSVSGLLPNLDCPHTRRELFVAGREPVEECDLHQRVVIDRATGGLAAADTPANRRAERVYLVLPPQAQQWAIEANIPQPPGQAPAETATPSAAASAALVMTSPDVGTVYRISPSTPREAQRIEVAARAGANVSFSRVEFYADDELLGSFSAPPYTLRWELQPGAHRFYARGQTLDGNWVESEPAHINVRE